MRLCEWISAGRLLLLLQLVAERTASASRRLLLLQAAGFDKLYAWNNVSSSAAAAAAATTTRSSGTSKAFQVYWNVPSFMCRKYRIEFPQLEQRFGIVQNDEDRFQGDKIAILYDPGVFPAFLQTDDNGTILARNGGVPQQGDLGLHLRKFREHVDELLADVDFAGLAVIDMESWRPIFRQNWASLQIYRNYSLELEKRRQPASWPPSKVKEAAARRFESSAREFMQATLRLANKLRPKARWGYYAYPYCFNWSPNQQTSQCAPQVKDENDQMRWLFGAASVLYPSVYLQRKLSAEQRLGMVRGRVQEAVRVADKFADERRSRAKVFAYYWYKYQDQRDTYVEKRDIVNTVTEIAKRGADGLILWGSSSDLNSRSKCEGFADYLDNVLGPALVRASQRIAEH